MADALKAPAHRREILDRCRAAFLGMALGDALGATTEFLLPGEIRYKYKVHNKIIGGGWLNLKPGQVTDDTQMSYFEYRSRFVFVDGNDILRSLHAHHMLNGS